MEKSKISKGHSEIIWPLSKGGLTSESFSRWLQSLVGAKNYPEHLLFRWIELKNRDLTHILGEWSQSEKLFEVKPPFFVQTGKKICLHSFQSDWNHKAGITCELAQGLSVLWLTLPAVSWKMKQKKTLKKVSMSTKFSSWLHEEKCDKIWIKLLSYSKFQFRFYFRFEPIIIDCKSWQMPFDFDLI